LINGEGWEKRITVIKGDVAAVAPAAGLRNGLGNVADPAIK